MNIFVHVTEPKLLWKFFPLRPTELPLATPMPLTLCHVLRLLHNGYAIDWQDPDRTQMWLGLKLARPASIVLYGVVRTLFNNRIKQSRSTNEHANVDNDVIAGQHGLPFGHLVPYCWRWINISTVQTGRPIFRRRSWRGSGAKGVIVPIKKYRSESIFSPQKN